MLDYLTTGTVLGLSAGFAPGPLLTLVISETLQHDIKAGVKVALSPLLTDAPIILLTIFVLAQLSELNTVLGIISLFGGAVILHMGYSSMKTQGETHVIEAKPQGSLLKGALANALSPHPYLFWLSVGGSIMHKAMGQGLMALIGFLGSFYICLIGAKVLTAFLVGRSKMFLSSTLYKYTMRLLGLALCILALILFREGWQLLDLFNQAQ